jgi:DNA mismatch repair ATPase MutS
LTLFATHYHELNELENKLPRVKNFHITNKEAATKIIFLRKLAPVAVPIVSEYMLQKWLACRIH